MRRFIIALVIALVAAPAARAQTATAFKTGEQTTGTTKQCYYSFAGSRYTETVQSYSLCPLSIEVRTGSSTPPAPAPKPAPPETAPKPAPPAPTPAPEPAPPSTATAFKTSERTTGTTKQCYYSFAGNEYTKTVQSYELCPLSIKVRL
jgi:hypothetical protein